MRNLLQSTRTWRSVHTTHTHTTHTPHTPTQDWTENIRSVSGSSNNGNDDDKSLPPVRKVTFTNPKEQVHVLAPHTTHTHHNVPVQVQPSDAKPKGERIKSFDFDAWSKFDGEKEAAKVDSEEPQVSATIQDKPNIPSQLSKKGTGINRLCAHAIDRNC